MPRLIPQLRVIAPAGAEHMAVGLPAFAPETVHREAE
jgi:hypothetical protein